MKALIVDDEIGVRKAVQLLVNWEEHHIHTIFEAANGIEALACIEKEHPQIILIDMMMPHMDGMELMQWIHIHAPSSKFIVISGHNDFDFVRNTLLYNGIDYILKPIEKKKINTAVEKAARAWISANDERIVQMQTHVTLNEYRSMYSDKLFTSLIDDPSAHRQTIHRLRKEYALPEGIESIRLAVLQLDTTDLELYKRFDNHLDLLTFSMLNICNEYMTAGNKGVAFRHWGTQNDIVLCIWKNFTEFPTILDQINHGIYLTYARHIHFGLSKIGPFPSSIPQLYQEGLFALQSRNLLVFNNFTHGRNVGEQQTVSALPLLRFSDFESVWKMAVLSGRKEVISQAVEDWISAIKKLHIITPLQLEQWHLDIKRFERQLLREQLSNSTGDAKAYSKETTMIEAPNPYKYVFSLEGWQRYWFQSMWFLSQTYLSNQSKGQGVISDIVTYIENNYQEDISQTEIASQFYVSREFVSRTFRKKFGMSFTDYISHIRINNAKILLLNPNLKITIIAEMVGFKSEKYFSQVFKKCEKMTPKEYRMSQKQNLPVDSQRR